MKICVLSGNLGDYDDPVPDVAQVMPDDTQVDIFQLTDRDLPPRPLAMTSRLMAGLPKMFGPNIKPGYDAYIWHDASVSIQSPGTAAWMLDYLWGEPDSLTRSRSLKYGGRERPGFVRHRPADIAIFKHPDRKTVREEWQFVKAKLEAGNRYLVSRYADEWLDQQADAIFTDPEFVDDALYASTAFIYWNTERVRAALKEWWYHKSRYLTHDQLALPYVLQKAGLRVNVIDEHYMKTPYFTFVRKPRRMPIDPSLLEDFERVLVFLYAQEGSAKEKDSIDLLIRISGWPRQRAVEAFDKCKREGLVSQFPWFQS
jgi:hypothetical protein